MFKRIEFLRCFMIEDYKFISNGEKIGETRLIEISDKINEGDYDKFDNELKICAQDHIGENFCLNFLKWDSNKIYSRTFESMIKFHEDCNILEPCNVYFLLPFLTNGMVHEVTHLDDKFDFFYSKQELKNFLSK